MIIDKNSECKMAIQIGKLQANKEKVFKSIPEVIQHILSTSYKDGEIITLNDTEIPVYSTNQWEFTEL